VRVEYAPLSLQGASASARGVDPVFALRHLSGLRPSHSEPGTPLAAVPPGASLPLEILFDYADPGSYLVFGAVELWGCAEGVSWRPLELRTPEQSPPDSSDEGWVALNAAAAEVAGALGLVYRPSPRIPRTRKAHELAYHAQTQGRFSEVHAALFRARFEDGLDLARVDVLVELAVKAGLDGSEVHTVLGVDRFSEAVEEERRTLLDSGARGVPTIRLPEGGAEGLRMEGFQGLDALRVALGLPEVGASQTL
jgi:predicted DsbA family dithiol-disulfide isomerase